MVTGYTRGSYSIRAEGLPNSITPSVYPVTMVACGCMIYITHLSMTQLLGYGFLVRAVTQHSLYYGFSVRAVIF